MNGRERMEAAFGPTGCRETPAVIPYEGIYIRDHLDAVSTLPWWYQYSPDIDQQMAWRTDVMAGLGQDWFRLPVTYSTEERRQHRIEAGADGVFLVDVRTGSRRRIERPTVGGWSATDGLESVHPDELPRSEADLDELIPIDEREGAALVASGKAELAHRLLASHGEQLYPTASVASPFWLCYQLWGFEGLMEAVVDRPELVRYACERYCRQQLDAVETCALLGARGVWIEECLADMLSPATFAAMSLPYVTRLAEAIRARGMHGVYYFCGNPAGKWELLLGARADALSLEEGKKGFGIDIEGAARRVGGKCVLFGNLDAINVLQNGSETELRAAVARQLAAGRANGGRFVMSLGSPVTPSTPPERVRAYCRLVRELADR